MQRRGRLKRTVFIEGLKIHVKCGVYPEERKLGVEVQLSVEVTSEKFVDYQELYRIILSVAEGTFVYLEEFQSKMLEKILSRYDPTSVRIRVTKLSVPFQNSFKGAGVELIWEKGK